MSLAMAFTMIPMMSQTAYAGSQVTVDGVKYALNPDNNTAEVLDWSYQISSDVTIPAAVKVMEAEYTVTSINAGAFNSCKKLETITIPDSVMSIGEQAFSFTGLKSVSFENNSKLTSIGKSAFSGCTSLGTITIPNSVTSIGWGAFYEAGLTSVTFESGSALKEIGEATFCRCKSLETITIPSSVMSIGYMAFYNAGLASVSFEKDSKLTSIGEDAFYCCKSLRTVTIPNSVMSIGRMAFSNAGLESVSFEKDSKLTSIGEDAFYCCKSLRTVTIPNSVTSIGEDAFGSSGLESVSFEKDSKLESIGEYAFDECESLGTVTIPDSVTSIGNGAFYGCKSLGTVTIPDSVTSIGTLAFASASFTSIVIPSGVTFIGWGAFADCNSLSIVYYEGTRNQWYNMTRSDYWAGDRDVKVICLKVDEPKGKTLIYNGKEQTGVDPGEGYTLSGGTVKATNPGTYSATATLKDGYTWTDGDTDPRTITWEIKNAAEKVTAPSGKTLTYNGKTQTGVAAGTGYTLTGTVSAANAGTYTATAALKSDANCTYKWSDGTTAPKTITWTINKAGNPLEVKGKTAAVRYSAVKKKSQGIGVTKVTAFTKKGQGKLTYTKASGNKKIVINKTTGKVTVKKGLKKGTYKVKVKVRADGNANYKASAWKTVTFGVRVK